MKLSIQIFTAAVLLLSGNVAAVSFHLQLIDHVTIVLMLYSQLCGCAIAGECKTISGVSDADCSNYCRTNRGTTKC